MKTRTLLLGLVAVVICSGCTQPAPRPDPPAPATVSVEPAAVAATPDDLTARLANCEFPEELLARMELYLKGLAALRIQYTDDHPSVIAVRDAVNRLIQQGLDQCVQPTQEDSPGHI